MKTLIAIILLAYLSGTDAHASYSAPSDSSTTMCMLNINCKEIPHE